MSTQRDPDTIYGPMGAKVLKTYKPGDYMKAGLEGKDIPDLDMANAQIQHERETQPAPEQWQGLGINEAAIDQTGPLVPISGTHPADYNEPAPPPPDVQAANALHAQKFSLPHPLSPKRPSRIVSITVRVPTTQYPLDPQAGLSISQEIRYNNLQSESQVQAIIDTLEELDFRLSAALNATTQPP